MILKIGLIIYIIVSAIHLLASFKENETLRKLSKPLIMLTIIATLIIYMISNNERYLLLLLAVIMGFLGDVLLLAKNKFFLFVIGAFAFFIGHLLYIVQMCRILPYHISNYVYLFLFVVLVIWSIIVVKLFKEKVGKLSICASLYYFVLFVGIIAAGAVHFAYKDIYSMLLLLGFILFFISDVTLAYFKFFKRVKRSSFYIMITYIAAQALLFYSLLMLSK